MDVAVILGGEDEKHRPRSNAVLGFARSREDFFRNTVVICTGKRAKYSLRKIAEAISMQDFLVANGVPRKSVLIEDKARDTIENFTHSRALIRKLNPRRIYVVTEKFHMARALAICKRIFPDIDVMPIFAADTSLSIRRLPIVQRICKMVDARRLQSILTKKE